MLPVGSSLHISKRAECKGLGRGEMGETFVQRPLVSYQPSSKHGDDVSSP